MTQKAYARIEKDQQIYYCLKDGEHYYPIDGDIFGKHTVKDTPVAPPFSLLAPVIPRATYAIGLNYSSHAKEVGRMPGPYPTVFMKAPNALLDPDKPILLPRMARSEKVDYECELAVVIGKTCKNVLLEEALSYVFGYTCANDVSARDWQVEWGGGQWIRGKSFDTFMPLGPVIVPAETINPQNLAISTKINGEVLQSGNTEEMIFSVAELISFLSESTTLLPGTVILTGTPAGVGVARTPPRWLCAGDIVEVTIEGIGTLKNPVAEE
jgi:2-keto-4-pentenoate hydratase/2-oxohepta-3-ene-1,7-dioic acid hydratase in catechol pathway